MFKQSLRINPLLTKQLAEIGANPSATPTPEQWTAFLSQISAVYTTYQSTEIDLLQSKLLYDELYDTTWRQTQELSLLVRIREAIASKMDLKSIIRTVVEATAGSFGYGLVSVYLLRDNMLYLQHHAGSGMSLNNLPINKGIVGRVARTGQAVLTDDSQNDPDFVEAKDTFRSEICVPIFKNSVVVGVLNVETAPPQTLTTNDLAMMTTLSEQIGSALERADLYTAVQESNQKYAMVVDNIREGIFQVDHNGHFTFLNKAWQSLSGYSVQDSIGQYFAKFVVPSEVKQLYQLQNAAPDEDEVRLQTKLMRPDGSSVPIAAHLQRLHAADGSVLGWSGTIMDISDRLKAEQQAREMQLLVQVQQAISSQLELKEMIRRIVEVTAAIFGYDLVCIYLLEGESLYLQHQIGYDHVIEVIPLSMGIAGRVVRTKTAVLIEDTTSDPDFLRAQDGITSEICIPLISNDQATGFINVETKENHRLTQADFNLLVRVAEQLSIAVERARLYTVVQASSAKYQTVVDNVREIIFQTDLDGKITFLNKAWERITGRSTTACLGIHFSDFLPAEEFTAVAQQGAAFLKGEEPHARFETLTLKADGTRIPVEIRLHHVYSPDGRRVSIGGTCTDITERLQAKQREQELNLLVQVRAAISSKLDLKDTIRTIVEATAQAFGYDLVSVYLLTNGILHLQHQIGYEILFDPVDTSVGVSGRVARTGIPALVQDASSDPDYVNAVSAMTSEVCVPLLNNGTIIGIMNVESKHKRLTETDLQLMLALSEHVTIAVERAQLYTTVVESNQKYEMVVNNVQEVIFQLDSEGIATFLNQSWTALTGFNVVESIGQHWSRFVHPDDREKAQDIAAQLARTTGSNIRYTLLLARSDSSHLPVEIHMQHIYDMNNRLMGFSGTITDISERMQAEKQAIDLMLKMRTVETLKGFLTGVSHDLRTPISVMNNALYLLRRKMGDEENRQLDALEKQTRHMQHVVEGMLDMSQLDDELAELHPIRIALNGLVKDVMVSLQQSADTKNQTLRFTPTEVNPFIMADQFMLGKMLNNVVKNAIQYTPEGGTIALTTALKESTVTITIQDSGIGIESSVLPHIFDRFYKGNEARPSGQNGTGLGLSIARRIAEMHGGTIEAQSTVGEGSTFTLSLPIGL